MAENMTQGSPMKLMPGSPIPWVLADVFLIPAGFYVRKKLAAQRKEVSPI